MLSNYQKREIERLHSKKSYGLIAKEIGCTRNQVAAHIFDMRYGTAAKHVGRGRGDQNKAVVAPLNLVGRALTIEEVKEIKRALQSPRYGLKTELAKKYGSSVYNIYFIASGRSWKWVEPAPVI